ncbi:MAG TPA: hypothetical protein VF054_09080 [Micromonosporaceae bacterium]
MRNSTDPVIRRMESLRPALATLIAEADVARRDRTSPDRSGGEQVATLSAFEDAFPTFYQFSNRPR